jgi:SAM-dependent methyltransferase
MNPQEYANIYQHEDHHWWYRGMRRISSALLAQHCPAPWGGWRVLDAGCGTGGILTYLAPYGRTCGIDASALALGFARCREHRHLAQASVEALPFPDATFDLVVSFDVLQHASIGDDRRAARELARVLRPGGWLLLRLPAYDWLRSAHDAFVHTRHRYTAGEVSRLIAGAGLALRRLTYANTLLFPLIAARRLVGRLSADAHSDVTPLPAPLNRLLEAALAVEARWLRTRSFPFGLTVVALAQKPGRWVAHEDRTQRAAARPLTIAAPRQPGEAIERSSPRP